MFKWQLPAFRQTGARLGGGYPHPISRVPLIQRRFCLSIHPWGGLVRIGPLSNSLQGAMSNTNSSSKAQTSQAAHCPLRDNSLRLRRTVAASKALGSP